MFITIAKKCQGGSRERMSKTPPALGRVGSPTAAGPTTKGATSWRGGAETCVSRQRSAARLESCSERHGARGHVHSAPTYHLLQPRSCQLPPPPLQLDLDHQLSFPQLVCDGLPLPFPLPVGRSGAALPASGSTRISRYGLRRISGCLVGVDVDVPVR